MTVKLLVALNGGEPLSVTFSTIRFVLGPWLSAGVHVKMPVVAPRFTPAGAETKPKVSVFAGKSASLATFVTTRVLSSFMVWFAGTVSAGALLSSRTKTVKLLVTLNGGEPSSVTRTVIKLVLGP